MPEQPDPLLFRRVLDVRRGTGNWLIRRQPPTQRSNCSSGGVNVSSRMVHYTRTQVRDTIPILPRNRFSKPLALGCSDPFPKAPKVQLVRGTGSRGRFFRNTRKLL